MAPKKKLKRIERTSASAKKRKEYVRTPYVRLSVSPEIAEAFRDFRTKVGAANDSRAIATLLQCYKNMSPSVSTPMPSLDTKPSDIPPTDNTKSRVVKRLLSDGEGESDMSSVKKLSSDSNGVDNKSDVSNGVYSDSSTGVLTRSMTMNPKKKRKVEYKSSRSETDDDPWGLDAATALDKSWVPTQEEMIESEEWMEDDDSEIEDDFAFAEDDDAISDDENVIDEELKKSATAPVKATKPEDVVDDETCIAFGSALKSLAQTSSPAICTVKGCRSPTDLSFKKVSTALYIHWTCSEGHLVKKWCSQPRLSDKGIHAGDFSLCMNTLLSGNNFQKVGRLFEFMGLGHPSRTFFSRVQAHYCQPVITEKFEEVRLGVIESLRGKEVILAGDGRNDSPGFSAQYCTYTLMLEGTHEIIAMVVVNKRDVPNLSSPNMERHGLKIALDELIKRGVIIKRIVTDAHSAIAAMIRKDYPDIEIQWDIWHGAKNLGKKMTEVANQKGNQDLLPWVPAVKTHFYECARTADGDPEVFMAKWRGMLHHVTNNHEWLLGDEKTAAKCEHGPLSPEDRDKPWLKEDSQEHKALRQVVLATRFINNAPKYVHFLHTGTLESFHSLILTYASKRYAFCPPVYKARNELAALDFMMNKDRPQRKKANGELCYKRIFEKRTKRWSVQPVFVDKSYAYVKEMQTKIILAKLEDPRAMARPVERMPEDPRNIAPTIAPIPPPPTSELVKAHISRMKPHE